MIDTQTDTKAKTQILIGSVLLFFAILYSQLSSVPKAQGNTTQIKQKSGWTLTVEDNGTTSCIADKNGKVLGYIMVDDKGNVELKKNEEPILKSIK